MTLSCRLIISFTRTSAHPAKQTVQHKHRLSPRRVLKNQLQKSAFRTRHAWLRGDSYSGLQLFEAPLIRSRRSKFVRFVERYLNDVADSVISVTSPRMGARFGAQPLTIEAHTTIHGNTAFQPLISPRKCILL